MGENKSKNLKKSLPVWSSREDYADLVTSKAFDYGFCLLPEAYEVKISDPNQQKDSSSLSPNDSTPKTSDKKKQSKTIKTEIIVDQNEYEKRLDSLFTLTTWDGREIFSIKNK